MIFGWNLSWLCCLTIFRSTMFGEMDGRPLPQDDVVLHSGLQLSLLWPLAPWFFRHPFTKDGGKDKHRIYCTIVVMKNTKQLYVKHWDVSWVGYHLEFRTQRWCGFPQQKRQKNARWIPIQSCQVILPPQGAGGPISMYPKKNHRNEAWWRWLKVVSLGRVALVFIHPPWLKMSYIPEN